MIHHAPPGRALRWLCTTGSLALLLSACASQAQPAASAVASDEANALILATLYANTSAEYEAATQSIYRAAEARLDAVLADTSHTASIEQNGSFAALPPAIVLDVDETVLDNSAYEVRLIEDGTSYPTLWSEWCNEAAARPLPGALEFTKLAASRGVTVFYVTNRKEPVKAGTLKNLVERGFPMQDGVDTLLMREGKPEWTGDKTTRRAMIAENYRIVMLFGDNAGDFVALADAKGTAEERRAALAKHDDRWGRSWFMLPNPMYGYWDESALGGNYGQPTRDLNRMRVGAMDAQR